MCFYFEHHDPLHISRLSLILRCILTPDRNTRLLLYPEHSSFGLISSEKAKTGIDLNETGKKIKRNNKIPGHA